MKRRVVITGIGCVSPFGVGIDIFWSCISKGVSGISKISRFDSSKFEVHLAGEIKHQIPGFSEYDKIFKEDVKISFALNAADQAMKDAGIKNLNPKALLHIGTSLETIDLQKIIQNKSTQLKDIVKRSLKNGARPLQMPLDTACELIETVYGSPGLKISNVSACAASTQAIGHAFRRIRDGSYDMALCGGFDSMINPLGIGGFQLLGALNTNNVLGERACRPFDAARSGTVIGEGAAMFVLEPLDQAIKMNKSIYAEIKGYGTSLDAYNLSAPDPEGAGGEQAVRNALNDANIKANKIDAVSAHGTGTYQNDKVEATMLRRIFGDKWKSIPVISTKSLVGHLIGAAGAIETAACIQGFVQHILHPNGSLQKTGDGCELDHIVDCPREFNGTNILKNSFGFGGQNAAIILGNAKHGN
ncbi:MAG: beta-ketoacyl-[acyl-carrier-protein] synthase family protein [Pseudomonadota bacterium]